MIAVVLFTQPKFGLLFVRTKEGRDYVEQWVKTVVRSGRLGTDWICEGGRENVIQGNIGI